MISDVLGAPARSDDMAGTLLVGSLLLLFSVVFPVVWVYAVLQSPLWLILGPLAVFPPLVALGYDVRVLEAGVRGEETVPSFVDWAGLVRTGLLSLVVRAVYLLPVAVFAIVGGAVVFGARTGTFGLSRGAVEFIVVAVILLVTLFALGHLVAYAYFRPAALAVFAVTGSLRSALSVRRTVEVAFSRDYAAGWTVASTILLVGLLVAVPLQLLLVGFTLAFYVRAAGYVAYGRGTTDALTSMGLVGGETAAETPEPIPVERDAPPAVQAGRGVGTERGTDDRSTPSDANKSAGEEPIASPADTDRQFDFDQEPTDSRGGQSGGDRPIDQRSRHRD